MVAGSLRRTPMTLLALLLGVAFAWPAGAALTWQPQGSAAFQVNTYTPSDQLHPAVAADAGGNVLVTWVDERETGNPDVWARRLDAGGQPRAPELHVDVENHGNGEAQSAQPLAHGDGGFSVVWSNFLPASPIGATVEVRAQRFDALGTRFGPETLVKTYHNPRGTLASRADTAAF